MFLTVSPLFQLQHASIPVQYKVRIRQHRDNVRYCVGWYLQEVAGTDDHIRQYRRSCQQLNGIYAPSVLYHEYKNLAPGKYEAFASLYRVPNYLAGEDKQSFQIIARD